MRARRTLLVTGGHGFVAGSILAQAGAEWDTHVFSRSTTPISSDRWRWHVCDPAVPGQLAQWFHEVQPQAVIHTAALAKIDFCEANPSVARAVNFDLTMQISQLCVETGARLVFCSTDTVFDGEHAPYYEDDLPKPVNVYGETKVAAEQVVSGFNPQFVIARLALVVGLPILGEGNSFLSQVINDLKQGRPVAMMDTEVRTPIDVITLGQALLELASGEHRGVYHLAGLTRVNRFEMAQVIAEEFGFSRNVINRQSPDSLGKRAPRPRDVSLASHKVNAQLKTPMRTLKDALGLIRSQMDRKLL
jgi:dTDP-4-dehydrorhamnose reductase